ncbi:peptidase M18, aminopeptidase I [Fistulina hepatica ATCC 64428]|uniref:aspartyl aminopeptidase n=1 Tax=Fistulina hepatica ATCC 64428 TaxID=1128425 RepID=A0A0D7A735_9AGAR|nr:peptidase M18, aminopeptidase I [Fistulina hepatica ATCC 64428]
MLHRAVGPEAAHRFLSFVNASPTPFHAVSVAASRLEGAGFRKIKEKDTWEDEVKPGGKYYFVRNQVALIAFTLPQQWKQGTGVSIVATHVDSPNLRVRPVSKSVKSGYLQVGVETYGGGIWRTWMDRDLSVAGRVVMADKDGSFTSKLLKIDQPILRIPSLAIHLDKPSDDPFKPNLETEFLPILGIVESQLNASEPEKPAPTTTSKVQNNHHSQLLSALADELSVAPDVIHDFELCLYDTQPAVLGGLNNEFIFSPRMDNLVSSFCAVEALADSEPTVAGNVNCIALFNHEEIGSVSTTGAQSDLLPTLLNRLNPVPGSLAQSIAGSFLISSDMAHGMHPNYPSKYQEQHRPALNGGVVIKTNAKQRYASDVITIFLLKQLAEKSGVNVQDYEVRNDMACGSTVGPLLSKIGVRTVDVGNPMLSMHSIRETAGSQDVQSCIDLFGTFFKEFATVNQSLSLD